MCPRAAMRLSCAGVNFGNIFSIRELVIGSPLRVLDIDVTYSVVAPDKSSLESFHNTTQYNSKIQPTIASATSKAKTDQSEWKTIGVKVRIGELPLLNRQLARFNYDTLGDLVRGVIAGKITQVTEDEQIEIMKTNLQTSGQLTGLSGKPYDFYKQIDVTDFLKYLKERYSDHTAKSYVNYFDKYATVFFSPNPDVQLLKLAPHKRSWILQAIKRLGDYYYRKYNNREVIQLIREIIERYDLNRDLDMKDRIYLVI
jgi:hypothetical protein